MLKSKYFVAPVALLTLVALGGGCGDDDNTSDGGSNGTNGDSGSTGGDSYDIDATLISVLDQDDSAPIQAPHQVRLLDTATGQPIPGLDETYSITAGKIKINGIPGDIASTLHVIGQGPADDPDSTYDAVTFGILPGTGDDLVRISTVGLVSLSEGTAAYTANPDRAAVGMNAYWTPGGTGTTRMGTIGCAKIYLDDSDTHLDANSDQRYTADNGLPTTPDMLDHTIGAGFFFGNMPTGEHTVRLSMDDGATFIAETTFVVPVTRAEALGPMKAIIYFGSLDVEVSENPSNTDC